MANKHKVNMAKLKDFYIYFFELDQNESMSVDYLICKKMIKKSLRIFKKTKVFSYYFCMFFYNPWWM